MSVETFPIYPRELSVTKHWSKQGIELLLETEAGLIAQALKRGRPPRKLGVIAECVYHGNPRKGAELARLFIEDDPSLENTFRRSFGDNAYTLLSMPLRWIPSCPSEYPNLPEVQFIQ